MSFTDGDNIPRANSEDIEGVVDDVDGGEKYSSGSETPISIQHQPTSITSTNLGEVANSSKVPLEKTIRLLLISISV